MFELVTGVRQGCTISPFLFLLHGHGFHYEQDDERHVAWYQMVQKHFTRLGLGLERRLTEELTGWSTEHDQ